MRYMSIVFWYVLRHDITQWSELFLSRIEGSLAYPSFLRRAIFSYISLQNLVNRLHEKQKLGSVRRVTRPVESPFCDGRDTLSAGPTVLHLNTLSRSSGPSSRETFLHINGALISVGQGQRIQPCYCPDWVTYEGAPKLSSVICKNHDSSAIVTNKVTLRFIVIIWSRHPRWRKENPFASVDHPIDFCSYLYLPFIYPHHTWFSHSVMNMKTSFSLCVFIGRTCCSDTHLLHWLMITLTCIAIFQRCWSFIRHFIYEKQTGAVMRPTIRYRGSADQLLANLFSLSIVTFPPKVFAKVNSAQFSRF